jgi:hypothetical protein
MMVLQVAQLGKKEGGAINDTIFSNKTVRFTTLPDSTMRITVLLNTEEAEKISNMGKKQWGAKIWGVTIEAADKKQWGPEVWGMTAITIDIKPESKLDSIVPKKK